MNFKQHSDLEGQHAFLGASKYHWVRYSDEKLKSTYKKHLAKQKGTELHEFASRCIELGQKLSTKKTTLNLFVNDSIKHGMTSEQPLYYSPNCFGTADAISFHDNILKISDLKTGETPAKFEQLEVYAAIFCLEYGYKPEDLDIELRIYQMNEVKFKQGNPDVINDIMDKIIQFDIQIELMEE